MARKNLSRLLYLSLHLPAALVTYLGYAIISKPALRAKGISRILRSVFEDVYDLSFSVKKLQPRDALNLIDEMQTILRSKQSLLVQHGYPAEPLLNEVTQLSNDIQAFVPNWPLNAGDWAAYGWTEGTPLQEIRNMASLLVSELDVIIRNHNFIAITAPIGLAILGVAATNKLAPMRKIRAYIELSREKKEYETNFRKLSLDF